ncbi:MAG: hypothetical protein WCO09_03740 [bacterium]
MEKITFEKANEVATNRMLTALGAYHIWKWISNSVNINNDGGKKEAYRILNILNKYNAVFQQLRISTYKSFVADLCIFFDKNGYEESFSIEKLLGLVNISRIEIDVLRKKIEKIKRKNGSSINLLQELRNADVGHQELDRKARHLQYKIIEDLFLAVQEILNLISNSHNRSISSWDHIGEEIEHEMKWIINNLERGEEQRIKEIYKNI